MNATQPNTIVSPAQDKSPLPVETITVAELAFWLATAWNNVVDPAAALRADSRGDDLSGCPKLSLAERTYTPATEAAYGSWGTSREVRWEWHDGKVGIQGMCRLTAEYIAAFVAKNGRVAIALRSSRSSQPTWRVFAAITGRNERPGANLDWRAEQRRQMPSIGAC